MLIFQVVVSSFLALVMLKFRNYFTSGDMKETYENTKPCCQNFKYLNIVKEYLKDNIINIFKKKNKNIKSLLKLVPVLILMI